jgi:hypothetical protein
VRQQALDAATGSLLITKAVPAATTLLGFCRGPPAIVVSPFQRIKAGELSKDVTTRAANG